MLILLSISRFGRVAAMVAPSVVRARRPETQQLAPPAEHRPLAMVSGPTEVVGHHLVSGA